MGVPVITPSTTTREQAITDIIESVALEETALSHILNAEGEKLQRIFAFDNITPETVLAANHSVESTVNAIAGLESVLEMKLRLFTDCPCSARKRWSIPCRPGSPACPIPGLPIPLSAACRQWPGSMIFPRAPAPS